jgi:hypothetical protein
MLRSCLFCTVVLGLVTPAFAEPRIEQARTAVELAAKVVDLEVQHEWQTRVAWDRAIAHGDAAEAGRDAIAHADALAALHRAQDGLRFARSYLVDLQHAE